jgi:hypothetical protein
MSNKINLIGQRFGKLIVLSENSIRTNSGQIRWNCKCDCGLETITRGYDIINGRTTSCGCNTGGHKEGENYTDLSKLRYWSKSVKNRDNNKCQKCDMKKHEMNAHHIIHRNNKDLRFEISNGITLCRFCHREFHRIYTGTSFGQIELNKYLGKEL